MKPYLFLAIVLTCSTALAQDDPPIPGDGGTNSITPPPAVTNVVGMPVIRIVSLRTKASTNDVGELVAESSGFIITTNNTVEVGYRKVSDLKLKYYTYVFGTINTLSNKQYRVEVSVDDLDDLFYPIELNWAGEGTNEHFSTTTSLSSYDYLWFRVREVP